ncbi:MAG: AgmX/PglI C-terminal domain-containing protein [Myxococcales bacterium]|nr:AgmX/PglI C-terminal domain-containing protein [Myxococcales bacterium]
MRQALPKVRACYQEGLAKDPKLAGRVTVAFVIDREGLVSNATTNPKTTDLSDEQVSKCIVQRFYELRFPAPEGGLVTVRYPMVFSPQD